MRFAGGRCSVWMMNVSKHPLSSLDSIIIRRAKCRESIVVFTILNILSRQRFHSEVFQTFLSPGMHVLAVLTDLRNGGGGPRASRKYIDLTSTHSIPKTGRNSMQGTVTCRKAVLTFVSAMVCQL